jgi:hypothetical protein
MFPVWLVAAPVRGVAALALRVAALGVSWSPATAWVQRDLPRWDLSAPERPGSYRQPAGDFAQAEEIAPVTLVQALVNRTRR